MVAFVGGVEVGMGTNEVLFVMSDGWISMTERARTSGQGRAKRDQED